MGLAAGKHTEHREEKAQFQAFADKVDRGLITGKDYVQLISQETGKPAENIWPEIFERILINHQLIHVIKKLKQHYKIGLLSNFVYEWLDHLLIHHRLHQYFDEIVISSKHKIIKPEPEIFQKNAESFRSQTLRSNIY